MRFLDRNDFFIITVDDQARIVRFERTPEPFGTLQDAEDTFERLLKLVHREDLRDHALLVDSRSGPGRNDDAFERVVKRYRDSLFAPFTRCAMLLRTQAGIMQSHRLSRDQEVKVEVFQDEGQAIVYLRTGRRGP